MTVETPTFLNPNYTLDGKPKPIPPLTEFSIATKRGDGSPAWFTWYALRHQGAYEMAKDHWRDRNGLRDQQQEYDFGSMYSAERGDRISRLERKPDGLRVQFNYDKTGTTPDWAWVFCTWDEIEAHSGGTRE